MKRFLMLVGVAVVAATMYVAAAPGSQQAKAPTAKQFNALKKQVATLSKKLNALTKDETAVKVNATAAAGFIATCFASANSGVLPINQFGSSTGTGYQVGTVGNPASAVTTALDVDATTTNFQGVYLQAVDPTCLASAAAARAQTRPAGGRLPLRAERSR
jgi:outer membrane murein-binding lipoprotein Lpp